MAAALVPSLGEEPHAKAELDTKEEEFEAKAEQHDSLSEFMQTRKRRFATPQSEALPQGEATPQGAKRARKDAVKTEQGTKRKREADEGQQATENPAKNRSTEINKFHQTGLPTAPQFIKDYYSSLLQRTGRGSGILQKIK